MRVVAWLLAATLLLVSAGHSVAQTAPEDGAEPVPDQGPPDELRADFPYGVLLADIGNPPRASEAGFRVMATTVSWRRTEATRGAYPFERTDQWGQTAPNDITNLVTAATRNGMKVGFRLIDPPDWAGGSPARAEPADLEDYVYHVVRYAHDALAYFELFNEQNLPFEWGGPPDPAGYARLMAAAYRGAARADASVPVISAGPSQRTGGRGGSIEDVDWLDGFLRAGGASSITALGVHAYLGSFDPSTDPSCAPLCFRQVEEFRAVMERDGAAQLPLYITEFGTLEDTALDLGQFNWMKLPADACADYLVRTATGQPQCVDPRRNGIQSGLRRGVMDSIDQRAVLVQPAQCRQVAAPGLQPHAASSQQRGTAINAREGLHRVLLEHSPWPGSASSPPSTCSASWLRSALCATTSAHADTASPPPPTDRSVLSDTPFGGT